MTRFEFALPVPPPHIVVVGDLMLDRYTWGDATRISPEAPIPVLRAAEEEVRPGGAASLAFLLSRLGAQVTLVGAVGEDPEARILQALLRDAGISCEDLVSLSDRPTTVKHRFVGRASGRHAHQILRVDRESTDSIPLEAETQCLERFQEHLAQAAAVLVADYGKGVCTATLVQEVFKCCGARQLPVLVDPCRGRASADYAPATLLKPNREEAATVLGRALESFGSYREAAQELQRLTGIPRVVITLDRDGIAIADQQSAEHVPTGSREVYDITGAGDMVMAVLGLGTACGWPLQETVTLANAAAGLQVERFGVAAVEWNEVLAAVHPESQDAQRKVRSLAEVSQAAAQARARGQSVVFTNGCFDLFHAGHLQTLEEAAALGDLLIVAINSDPSVRKVKGTQRPIVPAADRARIVAALECVDYVIVFDEETPHDIIEAIRPAVVTKGGTTPEIVGRELVESYGGAVRRTSEKPGISTTRLIEQQQTSTTAAAEPAKRGPAYVTDCECAGPGWCARHQCEKDRGEFESCRRLQVWFDLFESGAIQRERSSRKHGNPDTACRHRGESTGSVQCPSCQGHVQVKLFECALHIQCTLQRPVATTACCRHCEDYLAIDTTN